MKLWNVKRYYYCLYIDINVFKWEYIYFLYYIWVMKLIVLLKEDMVLYGGLNFSDIYYIKY